MSDNVLPHRALHRGRGEGDRRHLTNVRHHVLSRGGSVGGGNDGEPNAMRCTAFVTCRTRDVRDVWR